MKNRRGPIGFLMKFTAFSVAVAVIAISMGNTVTRMASSGAIEKTKKVIVIDAGHGGIDGGAVADDGTLEKDLNLATSRALEKAIRLLGGETVMTRTEDIMYADPSSHHKKLDDLTHRITTVENAGECVFVSIHMNKFPVQKYSGLQVYYSKNEPESKLLADAIQSTAAKFLQPDNSRTTKAAGDEIYLLSKLNCPAVLVECGFLSNPDELSLLKTEEYQNKLAAVIAVAVMEYINQE